MNIIRKDAQKKMLFVRIPEKFEEPKGQTEVFEENMLLACRISGILPMKKGWHGESAFYAADIRSCRALSEYDRPLKKLPALAVQLPGIIQNLENYLLSPDHLLLEADQIYVNDDGEVRLLYLPFYTADIRRQGISLAESLRPGLYDEKDLFVSRFQRCLAENALPGEALSRLGREALRQEKDREESAEGGLENLRDRCPDPVYAAGDVAGQETRDFQKNENSREEKIRDWEKARDWEEIGPGASEDCERKKKNVGQWLLPALFAIVLVIVNFFVLKSGILEGTSDQIAALFGRLADFFMEKRITAAIGLCVLLLGLLLLIRYRKRKEKKRRLSEARLAGAEKAVMAAGKNGINENQKSMSRVSGNRESMEEERYPAENAEWERAMGENPVWETGDLENIRGKFGMPETDEEIMKNVERENEINVRTGRASADDFEWKLSDYDIDLKLNPEIFSEGLSDKEKISGSLTGQYQGRQLFSAAGKEQELRMDTVACLMPEKEKGELLPFRLAHRQYIVGKEGTGSDIRLKSAAVNAIHAILGWTDRGYYVSDLNSRNGTKVNGRLIPGEERCYLKDGDRVAFGDAVFTFTFPPGVKSMA